MYKALPSQLEIKDSEVHGQGLFAKTNIPAGTNLGMSHIQHHSRWIRTPLGGFYNHSDEPNCIKKESKNAFKKWYDLFTLRDIEAGEEITVSYTLYKVK